MSRAVRFILIAGLIVFAIGVAWISMQGSRSKTVLAKYKAELRAKGEKLSAAELGYPRPPEPSDELDQLEAGLGAVRRATWQPGLLEWMRYVNAGRVHVCWAEGRPRIDSAAGKTNSPSWQEFAAQFATNADALAAIREATQKPPRWFYHDPTNLANRTMSPFIAMRGAAQWLGGDTIVALHARELDLAQSDLRALTQLAQFNREDYTLVSQMIRIAIAGLGLAATWEALQARGWSKEQLAELQKDWEAVDISDAFEKGMVGERAFGEDFLANMRSAGLRERAKYFKRTLVSGRHAGENFLMEFVAMPVWAANSDADELLYLQFMQKSLDVFRQLRRGTNMNEVNAQFKLYHDQLDVALSPPLAKFRYMYSALALPNYSRAGGTCVRNETLRRLAVTAIAIERYRLRHGRPPPNVNALVPELLSAVPIDPMSAKAMGYKLNTDGSFTLYSVGEDGRDDGGDPSAPGVTNKFDLWSGKDAVWPKAVFDTSEAN